MKKRELFLTGALLAGIAFTGMYFGSNTSQKEARESPKNPQAVAEDKVYTSYTPKIEYIELDYPSKQLPGVNYSTETPYGIVGYTGYPSGLAPLEIARGSETTQFGPPPHYVVNLDKHIDAYIPSKDYYTFFDGLDEISRKYDVAIWSNPSPTEFFRLLPGDKWLYNGEQTLDVIEFEKNISLEEFISLVSRERYDDAVRKYSVEKEKVIGLVDSIVELYNKYEVKKKR